MTPNPSLPLSVQEAIDAVCDRLEDAWQHGLRPELTAYLAELPEHEEALFCRLVERDADCRWLLGESPSEKEYARRFPKYASLLEGMHSLFDRFRDTREFLPPLGVRPSAITRTGDPVPPLPGSDAEVVIPDVPGYEIIEVLGRGGMGVVYKARHLALNRLVALKMILVGGHASDEQVRRFRAEAEAVACLQHPNILQIFEVGEHERLPFLTLEYVNGGSLGELVREEPLPPRTAAAILETIARAMGYAHSRGIVHRDLKPENILMQVERPGGGPADVRGWAALGASASSVLPKISDFNLAKHVEEDSHGTRSGTVLGTPSYMAPEQARGKTRETGPPSDVYALGAVLYRLLSGRPPFLAATQAAMGIWQCGPRFIGTENGTVCGADPAVSASPERMAGR